MNSSEVKNKMKTWFTEQTKNCLFDAPRMSDRDYDLFLTKYQLLEGKVYQDTVFKQWFYEIVRTIIRFSESWNKGYIYGYLTTVKLVFRLVSYTLKDQTKAKLSGASFGRFLIRFSESTPEQLVISIVKSGGQITEYKQCDLTETDLMSVVMVRFQTFWSNLMLYSGQSTRDPGVEIDSYLLE